MRGLKRNLATQKREEEEEEEEEGNRDVRRHIIKQRYKWKNAL